jgi:hypothetical protein
VSLVLIKAEGRFVGTSLGTTAPSYEAIVAAFRDARLGGNERDRGNWIGPGPRVTRTDDDSLVIRETHVTVAWLYGFPTGGPWTATAPSQDVVAQLVAGVARGLDSDRWTVTAVPYDPDANGSAPLWWATGGAYSTRTLDASIEGVAESPWGPPPSAITPRPPSVPAATQPAPTGMSTGAKVAIVGGIAAAAAAAYFATRKKSKRS